MSSIYRFRSLVLGVGLALLLLAATPGSLRTAEAQRDCDELLEDARESARQRDGFDVDALHELRECLIDRIEDRVEDRWEDWEDGFDGEWPFFAPNVSPNTILRSFEVDDFICLDFRANRTITSDDDTFDVNGGGYVGMPAFFTAFAYSGSFYLGGFSVWGVTVGPFLLQSTNLGGVQTGEFVSEC